MSDVLSTNDPIDSAVPEALPWTPAFPIAGIGAAGVDPEPILRFLAHLPERPGIALVLIQGPEPIRRDRLAEMLSRSTRLAVREAAHGGPVEIDTLYVVAPGVDPALGDGRFRLHPRGAARGPWQPLDGFLRSLAEEARGLGIGILLSAAGPDGALGLAEIKAAGGLTFSLPRKGGGAAPGPDVGVADGPAEFVLPPEEIARELERIRGHAYFRTRDAAEPGAGTEEEYRRILDILRAYSGVDFSEYRDATLKRRILRRMAVNRQDRVDGYLELLAADSGEVRRLYQEILINVTRFFRDAAVFDALKASVFPEIHRRKAPGSPLRVWVAGCASGEEAYSLAMSLVEFQDGRRQPPPIRIFATDIIESAAMEKARQGVFPASIAADVPEARLRRFFTREGRGYRINQEIRDLCVFARQNLAEDPPYSRLDLVACRNVLIYLSPRLQRKVLAGFHYALDPAGFLVLGSSETVGQDAELFHPVDAKNRIYARKAMSARGPGFGMPGPGKPARGIPPEAFPPSLQDYVNAADRLLQRRPDPAGILVNRDLDILQFRGRTGPYLEPSQGNPSFQLMHMAPEILFLEIREAIRAVEQRGVAVHRTGVRIRDGEGFREVDLEVLPVRPAGAGKSCFLVLFTVPDGGGSASAIPAAASAGPDAVADAEEMAHLRRELAAARAYFATLREQYDVVNAELATSHEEMRSSNEGLQSANEELETAREELQSTNEELTTLNEELRSRDCGSGRADTDLDGLFASLGVPAPMSADAFRGCRLGANPAFLIDARRGIQYVNRGACARLGYSREELLALRYSDLDVGQGEPAFQALFEQAFAGGMPRFASELNDSSGIRIPVECTVAGLRVQADRLLLIVAREIEAREPGPEIQAVP